MLLDTEEACKPKMAVSHFVRIRKANKKKKLSQRTKGIAQKRSRGLDWALMKWPEALLSVFKQAFGMASH